MAKKITLSEALRLMNSDDFEKEGIKEEKPFAVAPRASTSLATKDQNDINQKIINKLVSISKALADEFGFDQKVVMQDMINDLRITGGEEIIDVIKGDTPIEQMTKQMASAAKEIGIDSNIAIQALLQMDEKKSVEMFKKFMAANGGQLTYSGDKKQLQGNGGMKFLESFKHRVLLDEDLAEIQSKYYADIKKELFDKLIALDPTFEEGQEKLGTYGKWILNTYKNKNLKERDFPRVEEILFDFNDRKRYITAPNGKDIFTYKTIDEVRNALNNIQLTANQVAKQNRKAKQHADLGEDAEFIGENENWEIWSPKTYAASCKLGSGTTWCTASTSYDGYFNSYTNSGKLYIFYPKSGEPENKFQAHVKNGHDVTTFMDAKDRPSIDFSTFIFQENLLATLKASELKNVDAILEVENIERVSKGEPYMYAGGRIKSSFTTAVKIIKFVPEYDKKEIPAFAFKNCINLEEVHVPEIIESIGIKAFEGCQKVTIFTPKHKIKCYPSDLNFLKEKIKYIK